MKLSAVWIAKNEEDTLPRSMKSVAAAVDEMVVVDTGSTDRTAELAEELGARVVFFEWIKDFSAARNFALEQATGDAVVFLDADEWFEPALTPDDARLLEAVFQHGYDSVMIRMKQLTEEGATINENHLDRIMRRCPEIRYQGAIHEALAHTGGISLNKYMHPDWVLLHSGYYRGIMPQKLQRNIELLEEELARTDDPQKRYINLLYLVREYKNLKRMEECGKVLRQVLDAPQRLAAYCRVFQLGSIPLLYELMEACCLLRDSVSRLEVKKNVFAMFVRAFPTYRGAAAAELYYRVMFDLKEDRLLAELDRVMEKAKAMEHYGQTQYHDAEAQIYSYAAAARWRRRDYGGALDCAVACARLAGTNFVEGCCSILLRCVKGQPVEEIILFLNSVYDTHNNQILGNLASALVADGYRDAYLYYTKRQIDGGSATQGDFLFYLLVLGEQEKALEHALSLTEEENGDAVSEFLFLLAICGEREDIAREHRDRLGAYSRILDAYFAGGTLADITKEEELTFLKTYRPTAFYRGIDGAEKYRAVFYADPSLVFRAKALYCAESGRADLILRETMIGIRPDDFECYRLWVDACLDRRMEQQAYDALAALLESGADKDELLHQLLVVAERDAGDLGKSARRTYEGYLAVHDRVVELRDIVNTGYVPDDYTKKQLRALGSMTKKQLNQTLEALKPLPFNKTGLYWAEKAAQVCLEQRAYGPAQDCLLICLAGDYHPEENRERLREVFQKLGNAALAKELASKENV